MDEDRRLADRRPLNDDPRIYDAYARYFVRLHPGLPARRRPDRRGHAAERAAEPQPERLSRHGPARRRGGAAASPSGARCTRAGLRTKILGYDHNWSLHPNDVGPPGRPANPGIAAALLRTPAATTTSPAPPSTATPAIPSASRPLHDAFPHEGICFTECSGSHVGRPRPRLPGHPALARALPHRRRCPATGPRRSSRGTSRSTRAADRTTAAAARAPASSRSTPRRDTATRDADYYALGHVARFVRPGAVRIDSDRSARLTRLERRLPQPGRLDRARRPQRRLGHDDPALRRRRRRESFSYALPGGAVATFVCRAARSARPLAADRLHS